MAALCIALGVTWNPAFSNAVPAASRSPVRTTTWSMGK
ncbi:hypothetical protein CEV32_4453 [Brucella rhizosphaerae]|uniref:Uncharacterized protein n=1 Tax=Brucella rhizosphaerae TaxID=571254 RepID=A0A256FMY4_9HYPH|nr:hypothetical protein CEV32_4453 [Brucella rhizosphaerae]